MKREKRRDEPLVSTDANVVVNSDLVPQLTVLVDLVLNLGLASVDVPASSHGSDLSPAINPANLIHAVTTATGDVLKSPTVANVDKLVHTSTLLGDLLGGCGCVDALGLRSLAHYLDKVIDAALAIQKWCGHNPVTLPAHPSGTSYDSSSPTSIPNTSNNATVLGLDDLLTALGLTSVKSHVDVGGLGPGLNKPLNDLLNSLGIGPANVHPRDLNHASTIANANTDVEVDEALLKQMKEVVMLVVKLKNDSPLPAPSSDSHSIALPVPVHRSELAHVDGSLVDAIVQATANLLKSANLSSLLNNINALITVNSLAANTLASCGCVDDLGLARVVENLEKVLAATLRLKDWCAHHPVVVGPTPSSNVPGLHHGHDGILGTPIDLGLNDLLAALGLDVNSNADADLELQGLVNVLVQLVLNLRDDSTSLPPSPPSPSHTSTGTHGPPAVVSQNLIDAILQATGSLLRSLTGPELLSSVDALLDINVSLGDVLSGCGCVDDLGLGHLVKDVEAIVKAALAVKNWCSDHGNPASPGSSSGSGGSVVAGSHPSPSTPIIINAEDLLRSLGLDGLIKVDGIVGGLGDAINKPVNSLLGSLGLGGVRRWFGQ
jgi:hypothetical protein